MAAAQILSVTKLPARRYNKAREKVMHMRDIGKNIRDARVKGGITQDQLAERLRVSRQTVSHYETGHSRPDIEMLEQIAQALEVDITILLYGAPPRSERQREIRHLLLCIVITVLLLVAYGASAVLTADFSSGFFGFFAYLRPLILLPCACLGLGWVLFQSAGLLLGAHPLSSGFARYLRWGLLAVLIGYFLLVTPFFCYLFHASLELWQLRQTDATVSYSSSFRFPGSLNSVFIFLIRHVRLIPAAFFATGAGLWITGQQSPAAFEAPPSAPATTDEK